MKTKKIFHHQNPMLNMNNVGRVKTFMQTPPRGKFNIEENNPEAFGDVIIPEEYFKLSSWTRHRVMSDTEAYIYLLRCSKHPENIVHVGQRKFLIGQNEVIVTLRGLCFVFGWEQSRVRKFLARLIDAGLAARVVPRGSDLNHSPTWMRFGKYAPNESTIIIAEPAATNKY